MMSIPHIFSRRRQGWIGRLCLIFLIGFIVAPARASEALEQWVTRIVSASGHHSYTGDIRYYRGEGDPYRIRMTYNAKDAAAHDAFKTPHASQIELVWQNGRRAVFRADRSGSISSLSLINAPSPETVSSEQIQSISRNYRLKHVGKTTVAGRRADFIVLAPKYDDRFEYRAWLDVETGILLGASRRNESGDVVEAFYFTRFELLGDAGLGAAALEDADSENRVESVGIDKRWSVSYLPDGFMETGQLRRKLGMSSKEKTEQWTFSDGLNTLSIFFKLNKTRKQSEGGNAVLSSRRRSTSIAVRHCQGYDVIVTGEIPIHTATQIAAGVRPSSP